MQQFLQLLPSPILYNYSFPWTEELKFITIHVVNCIQPFSYLCNFSLSCPTSRNIYTLVLHLKEGQSWDPSCTWHWNFLNWPYTMNQENQDKTAPTRTPKLPDLNYRGLTIKCSCVIPLPHDLPTVWRQSWLSIKSRTNLLADSTVTTSCMGLA